MGGLERLLQLITATRVMGDGCGGAKNSHRPGGCSVSTLATMLQVDACCMRKRGQGGQAIPRCQCSGDGCGPTGGTSL